MNMKCILSLGVSWAVLAASPAALAQAAEGNGDIVVTATRRAERLADVPISAAAISSEAIDLRGFRSFSDIAKFTPGVEYSNGSNLVSIRGISTTAGAATTGIYVDDTPIQNRNIGTGRSQGAPQLFDVERVEVLRGPQGTLFGAGSMGGTVRFITPEPSLTDVTSYGRAEGNSVNGGDTGYEIGAAAGGPLVQDKVGLRVSGSYRRSAGYVDRIDYRTGVGITKNVLGEDTNSSEAAIFRAAVKFAPTASFSITPSVLYQSTEDANTSSFWESFSDIKNGRYYSGNPRLSPSRDHYWLPAVAAKFEGSGFDIISNTSYLSRDQLANNDNTTFQAVNFGVLTATGPNVPGLSNYTAGAEIQTLQRNFTQEVRVQSAGESRLQWVAGVFYQHNEQTSIEIGHDPMGDQFILAVRGRTFQQLYGVGTLPPDMTFYGRRESLDEQIAGFADVTFALTDALKLNAGLRYAHSHFEFNSRQDGPYNGGLVVFSGKLDEDPVTPKYNITYQPSRDHLFYATASKGFRVGGAVRPAPASVCAADFAALGLTSAPPTYNSDSVWSYELGAKDSFFDSRLRTAASVYSVDWNDIQTTIALPNCGFNFVANAAKAKSEGFDLQLDFQATDAFSVSATAGYNNARFTETVLGAGKTAAGVQRIILSDGNTLGNRPWTATLAGDYRFKIADRDAYMRADFAYASQNPGTSQAMDPRNTSYDAAIRLPEATYLTNFRTGVHMGPWDVSAFVDNAFDSHPILSRGHESRASQLWYLTTFRPRTVGITAVFRK
jgi:outer membrane receptor protein involved in Fe transport